MSRLMIRSVAVLGCLLVPLLAACGSEEASGSSQAGSTAPVTGCTIDASSTELFVKERYDCPEGKTLYVFATGEALENWQAVAKEFGLDIVDNGDNWILVKE